MTQTISKHSSGPAAKGVHEPASKHATQHTSKAETNIEKARDMAVYTLQRNLVDLKDLKVIKVAREDGGWDVAVEVFEESSFIRALGLPTRVQDNNLYEVKMDESFEVQSYERKGPSHIKPASEEEEL